MEKSVFVLSKFHANVFWPCPYQFHIILSRQQKSCGCVDGANFYPIYFVVYIQFFILVDLRRWQNGLGAKIKMNH